MNGSKSLTSPKTTQNGTTSILALMLLLAIIVVTLISLLTSAASSLYATSEVPVYNTPVDTALDREALAEYYRQDALRIFYRDIAGQRIADAVLAAAQEYGIKDEEILFALMWKESRFQHQAVNYNSTSVDRGLFQLNSLTYPQYTDEHFFDVEWNIRMGVRHYATELAVVDGNHQYALHAYNAGRARRYNPPRSTQIYARRILERAQEYRDAKTEFVHVFVTERIAEYR